MYPPIDKDNPVIQSQPKSAKKDLGSCRGPFVIGINLSLSFLFLLLGVP